MTSILMGAGGSSLPLFKELERPSSTGMQQPLTPLCALLSAVEASLQDSILSISSVDCTGEARNINQCWGLQHFVQLLLLTMASSVTALTTFAASAHADNVIFGKTTRARVEHLNRHGGPAQQLRYSAAG